MSVRRQLKEAHEELKLTREKMARIREENRALEARVATQTDATLRAEVKRYRRALSAIAHASTDDQSRGAAAKALGIELPERVLR